MDSRLKSSQNEGHELRLKVNQLLEERQAQLCKLERFRVTEWDLLRQYDMEHKLCIDAKEETKKANEKTKSIAQLLSKQMQLKEMFEDKMKDALDMNFSDNQAINK